MTELMLERMFIGWPVGNYDRILDFSTALTGALFFVPSADFLDDSRPCPTQRRRARSRRGPCRAPAEQTDSATIKRRRIIGYRQSQTER